MEQALMYQDWQNHVFKFTVLEILWKDSRDVEFLVRQPLKCKRKLGKVSCVLHEQSIRACFRGSKVVTNDIEGSKKNLLVYKMLSGGVTRRYTYT